jgi:hypothetical protein
MTTEVKQAIIPDEQPVVTSATLPPSKETKSSSPSASLEINLEETRIQSPAGDATTERFLADTLRTDEQVLALNSCKSVLDVLKQGKAFIGPCPGADASLLDKEVVTTNVCVYGPVKSNMTEELLAKGETCFKIPCDPVFSQAVRDASKRKCVMIERATIIEYSTEGLRWPIRANLSMTSKDGTTRVIEAYPFQDVCNWDDCDAKRPVGTCFIPPGIKHEVFAHQKLVDDEKTLRLWRRRLRSVPIWEDFKTLDQQNSNDSNKRNTVLVDMTEYLAHPASSTAPFQSWLVARFWAFLSQATLRLHPTRMTLDSLIVEVGNSETKKNYLVVDKLMLGHLFGVMAVLSGQSRIVDLSGDPSDSMNLDIRLCGRLSGKCEELLAHLKTLRKEQAWGNRDEMVLSAWDKVSFKVSFQLRTFTDSSKVLEAVNQKRPDHYSSTWCVNHDGTYKSYDPVFDAMVKPLVIYQPPEST